MRCLSCNANLTDREATRKGVFTGDYIDLCERCISTIPDFEYVENPLASDKPVVDEAEFEVTEETDD